jgi:uncharacterized membrane protein
MIFEFVQATAGLAYVTLLPGYALSWAMFPDNRGIDFFGRVVLSFGLSLGLVLASTLFFSRILKLPFTGFNSFMIILFIILLSTLAAVVRRRYFS